MSVKNIFILLVCSMSFYENSFSQRTHIDTLFNEVNSTFTIDGMPINPRVIHDLTGGDFDMSDGSVITSLDLGMAQQCNRYYCDTCLGKYDIDYGVDKDGRWQGRFSYYYLGKTTNNVHVVQTNASGGGSGSWSFIMFLSAHVRTAYRMGEKQKQLIMTLEGIASGSYGSARIGSSMTMSKVTIKKKKVIIDYTTSGWTETGEERKSTERTERKVFQF